MTADLHADAAAISSASPAIKKFAQDVADILQPLAPAPAGKLWGISPSNDWHPPIDAQMAEYVTLGVRAPRIEGTDAAAQSARAHGFKHWFAWLSGDGSATPAQAVAYATKYPEAVGVGIGNELNGQAAWTTAKVETMQKNLYAAMDTAGFGGRVLLSSVGNRISAAEGLSMLDWCKKLAALGCTPGHGFAIADYHNYGLDPVTADTWQECWTVGRHGTCCQDVFGKPPFIVSEFGAKIGWTGVDATTQATAAAAWVAKLATVPECIGGHWFEAFDGVNWSGFGLIDAAGNRRPSWQAFKSAIAKA